MPIDSSFHVSVVTVTLVLAWGKMAEYEDEHSTKRLTVGSLAAACIAFNAPWIESGMTTVGSGLKVKLVAVWTTAEQPTRGVS